MECEGLVAETAGGERRGGRWQKSKAHKREDIMGGGGSDAEEIFKRDVKEEKRGRL